MFFNVHCPHFDFSRYSLSKIIIPCSYPLFTRMWSIASVAMKGSCKKTKQWLQLPWLNCNQFSSVSHCYTADRARGGQTV